MTSIEWTEKTFNPVIGCERISPGCDHCYAITQAHRVSAMRVPSYQPPLTVRLDRLDWTGEARMLPDLIDQPLSWQKPAMIFVCSMSDLFHKDVTDEFIIKLFAMAAEASHHTFQILTKRTKRMARLLNRETFEQGVYRLWHNNTGGTEPGPPWEWPIPNIWLGTSIESDKYTFRADHLRQTPAAVRWVSAEPLLGPLNELDLDRIDWVVAGGESGSGARPMHPRWVQDLRDNCSDTGCPECGQRQGGHQISEVGPMCGFCGNEPVGTAFFFKQWGQWFPEEPAGLSGRRTVVYPNGEQGWATYANNVVDHSPPPEGFTIEDSQPIVRVRSKKDSGRILDGRMWDEYPTGKAEP